MQEQPKEVTSPVSIFYSYAHEDEALRNELEKHLSILRKQGFIESWYDRLIVPGTDWASAIDRHLSAASIILLLISPDFLASDYCYGVEMQRALERNTAGTARVIPIILRSVYWHDAPFAHLQCLPRSAKPVKEWGNRDAAFRDVVEGIRMALKEMSDPASRITHPSHVLQPDYVHGYSLQEHFTGRVRERQMLTEWLIKGKQPLLALIAFAGTGKSSLASFWWQHDVRNSPLFDLTHSTPEEANCHIPEPFRPEGVFWWSFDQTESHFTTFLNKALTYASNGNMNSVASSSTHEKVERFIDQLCKRRLLLILDGFEYELRAYASLSAVYQGEYFTGDTLGNYRACTNPYVADFLKGVIAAAHSLKSHLLLTSGLFPHELDNSVGCRREDLLDLDPQDAVSFFQTQGIKGTRTEIQKMCALYGYHPLTIGLLAGRIRDDEANPGDLEVALEYNPVSDPVSPTNHILKLSYDALSSPTRELLSLLATFRSQMEYQAVKIVSPFHTDQELKEALRDLIARGLLLFDREGRRYNLHPIIRHYVYDRLTAKDKKTVHTRLRKYFASVSKQRKRVRSLEDLTPVIELYHHTICAGQKDEAWKLYNERISTPLYYQLGEYEIDLQLLAALPHTSDGVPDLSLPSAKIWALLGTTMCYERTGQAKLGLDAAKKAKRLARNVGDEYDYAAALTLHSMPACDIGQLRQASTSLCKSIDLFERMGNVNWQGISHRSYGRVLMCCGKFTEAWEEFNAADRAFDLDHSGKFGFGNCVVLLFRAQLCLLQQKPSQALQLAHRAKAWSQSRSFKQEEIKATWLQGAALIALAAEEKKRQNEVLTEAQSHLNEALADCRRVHLRDVESDILLALAYWYYIKGDSQHAWEHAKEALMIADDAEYRLKQADIHNLIALMALDAQDHNVAERHARAALDYAECDDPLYCYKPALERAKELLHRIQAM